MPAPHPELNGLRLFLPNDPELFLIDNGLRRHIPNPPTAHNLFGNNWGQQPDLNLLDVQEGSEISDGSVLAQAKGQAPVYLVENGTKRHIVSPAIMAQYGFSGGAVQVVAPILLSSITNGPDIS